MQQMHREVGSAVLLLSRFVGQRWDTSEAVRLAEERAASTNEAANQLFERVGNIEERLTVSEESKPDGDGRSGTKRMIPRGGDGHYQMPSGLSGREVVDTPKGEAELERANKLEASRHPLNADRVRNAGADPQDRCRQPSHENEIQAHQPSPLSLPLRREIAQRDDIERLEMSTSLSLSKEAVSERFRRPGSAPFGDVDLAETDSGMPVGAGAAIALQRMRSPQNTVDTTSRKDNICSRGDAVLGEGDKKAGETSINSVGRRCEGSLSSNRRDSSFSEVVIASSGISSGQIVQAAPSSRKGCALTDSVDPRRMRGHTSDVDQHADIGNNVGDRNMKPEEPEKTAAGEVERGLPSEHFTAGEVVSVT
ncbi:unnamed protein product [Ascophyllum nodosum]